MKKLDKILNFLKENYEFMSQGHKIDFKDAIQIHNNIVDVSCSIFISNNNIISLTNGLFKFGKINGTFDCSNCKNLKSLEGGPIEVGGTFDCSNCKNLKSLEGGPIEVGGDFDCSNCYNLKSLEGSPKVVGRDFYCNGCENLKSLKGGPETVDRHFNCVWCPNIISLKDSPKKIGGKFIHN